MRGKVQETCIRDFRLLETSEAWSCICSNMWLSGREGVNGEGRFQSSLLLYEP